MYRHLQIKHVEPFYDRLFLVFSFWRCECSVSLATWTPQTQEESRPPPCRPQEPPPALRRVILPLSPPQAATPLMDPGTIYPACSTEHYVFLCNLQYKLMDPNYVPKR